MSSRKPVVYIAGPYSKPDPCVNTHVAMTWWDKLYSSGIVAPICPHWSHLQHTHSPREYQEWIDYDLQLLHVCDALLRIPGESSGADGEVTRMTELGKPVFHSEPSMREFWEWCRAFMEISARLKTDRAILNEMREESLAGRRKYGGSDPAAHDASHSFEDWRRYIADHVERARISPPQDARQHMIKAGGLALSAARAFDAKCPPCPRQGTQRHESVRHCPTPNQIQQ